MKGPRNALVRDLKLDFYIRSFGTLALQCQDIHTEGHDRLWVLSSMLFFFCLPLSWVMGIGFMLELEPVSVKFPGVCGATWDPGDRRNERIYQIALLSSHKPKNLQSNFMQKKTHQNTHELHQGHVNTKAPLWVQHYMTLMSLHWHWCRSAPVLQVGLWKIIWLQLL